MRKELFTKKYFLKLKKRNSRFILNNYVAISLLNWSSFDKLSLNDAQNKINFSFNSLKKETNKIIIKKEKFDV